MKMEILCTSIVVVDLQIFQWQMTCGVGLYGGSENQDAFAKIIYTQQYLWWLMVVVCFFNSYYEDNER